MVLSKTALEMEDGLKLQQDIQTIRDLLEEENTEKNKLCGLRLAS
jgi:hypothetical protein